MGARISQEMVEAKRLVTEAGMTAYRAAKQTGLTVTAITRHQWYADHVAAQGEKVDNMAQARIMVTEQGMTAYAAAKKLGISQSAISRAKWYRDYKNSKEATSNE